MDVAEEVDVQVARNDSCPRAPVASTAPRLSNRCGTGLAVLALGMWWLHRRRTRQSAGTGLLAEAIEPA